MPCSRAWEIAPPFALGRFLVVAIPDLASGRRAPPRELGGIGTSR
jgi:hypothetical protein